MGEYSAEGASVEGASGRAASTYIQIPIYVRHTGYPDITVTWVTPTYAVGIVRARAYSVHIYTYTARTSRKCGLTLHVQRPGYPYRCAYIYYIQYISRGAALTLHGGCIFSCPEPVVDPTDFGRVNPPARPGRVKHGRRGISVSYTHLTLPTKRIV